MRNLAVTAALLSGCAAAPVRAPELPILDLTTEFLDVACAAEAGEPFATAWLAYEERHFEVFGPLYYDDEEARTERAALARELGPRRDEVCLHARVFMETAPGVIERMRPRVRALMGRAPTATVVLPAALQWTDGRSDTLAGKNVIALNTRHDSYARTAGIVATIAHELIHDTQGGDALPPVARSLYREGGAVFGVQLILPGLGRRALGFKEEAFLRAADAAPAAARELLAAIDERDVEGSVMRRFFSGGYEAPDLPPKMGYYLGLRVYEAIAAERGAAEALRIAPEAFAIEAKKVLAGIRGPSDRSAPAFHERVAPGGMRHAACAVFSVTAHDAFIASPTGAAGPAPPLPMRSRRLSHFDWIGSGPRRPGTTASASSVRAPSAAVSSPPACGPTSRWIRSWSRSTGRIRSRCRRAARCST